MIVQGPVIQGEGSTHPVESPTQSPVADKVASTGMDVKYGGATTTVTGLEVGQGSGNIDKTLTMPQDSPLQRVNTLKSDEGSAAYTKLIKKVKKLKNKVKSSQARRRARIIVPDDEDDLEDPSKQGAHVHVWNIFLFLMNAKVFTAEKDVSTAKPVSTAGATITTASVAVSTTKDKAVGSSKRDANEEFDQESSKRQKISESSEPAKEPKDKERELSKRAYNK
ncbi:hypothetical protein Tco_1202949 [Tanacetum coccineum]